MCNVRAAPLRALVSRFFRGLAAFSGFLEEADLTDAVNMKEKGLSV
jgi:hypothetical protein